MSIANKALLSLIITMFIMMIGTLFIRAIDTEAKSECIKWNDYAKTVRSDVYFVREWQVAQCDAVGIKLIGQVK